MKIYFYILSLLIATIASNVLAQEYDYSNLLSGQNGEAAFITGGIGEDELLQLEQVKHSYNVRITSSDKNGHYIADAKIIIRDNFGTEVINSDSGPLFYALLPNGKYIVETVFEGKSKKKNITATIGKTTLVGFAW
jgi:hypothetical protein